MAVRAVHDNRRHVIGLQRSILTGSEMNLAGIEVIELCICLFSKTGIFDSVDTRDNDATRFQTR